MVTPAARKISATQILRLAKAAAKRHNDETILTTVKNALKTDVRLYGELHAFAEGIEGAIAHAQRLKEKELVEILKAVLHRLAELESLVGEL